MSFLHEKSILSQRGSKSSPEIAMIGPRIQLSTCVKLSSEGFDQSFEELQKSTTNDSEERQYLTSLVCSYNPTNRSMALRATDIKEEKPLKTLRKMGQHPSLKSLITEQKIKMMVKNFIKKLSRNNVYSKPVDYTPFFNEKEVSFLDTQGIQLNDVFEILHFICSILLIIAFSIMSTLCLVLKDIEASLTFNIISTICLIYFAFEIFLNLITVKFQEGKRLSTLRQILHYYGKKTFTTDLLIVIILFVDQFIDSQHLQIGYLRIFIIFKLSQVFQKIEKLQVFFIRNFYYEQYWSLVKVFLFNFSLAHLLAIGLIGMASINMEESWMSRKQILDSPWYEKYAWSYYWATTIMLTVGFGDLNASNFEEAICLTFIEMISCIALGYNINCVGMLISNIRAQDLEKGKNFKIFYKLSRKNNLSQDLEWRISNYIEESSNIKKQFNHDEENQFVQKLPQGLKTQFLKESNKKIFKNLPFFKNLTERTVFRFAQKIAMRICHPEEIIQNLDDRHNLLILKGGEIGFTCKRSGCKYNSTVIDQLKVSNTANPMLISLGFIRNPRMNYEIKSLAYSVLYFLDYESILSILKTSQMDYQIYCLLKDKTLRMPDDFELFDCEICKQKHTKFTCPKLHFIPIKQNVINHHIFRLKTDRNARNPSKRFLVDPYNVLANLKKTFQPRSQRTERNFFAKILYRRTSRMKEGLVLSKTLSKTFPTMSLDENMTAQPLNKQISDIKDYFSRSTAELIKHEIGKALYFGECRDEVWTIQADRMKNYMHYFEQDNSSNLMDKWINSVFYREKIESLVKSDHVTERDIFKLRQWSQEDSLKKSKDI